MSLLILFRTVPYSLQDRFTVGSSSRGRAPVFGTGSSGFEALDPSNASKDVPDTQRRPRASVDVHMCLSRQRALVLGRDEMSGSAPGKGSSRPDGRGMCLDAEESPGSQGRVVANGNPGRPAGQCNREQTARSGT